MTSRDHRAAVERRLALLRPEPLELPEPPEPPVDQAWWSDHTHVAGSEPVQVPVVEHPPALPVPGRHASRRRIALLPPTLAGRVEVGPWQVAVVALVLAAALAVTAWTIARSRPSAAATGSERASGPLPALASAAPSLAAASSAGSSIASSTAGPSSAASVTVDVSGQVRHPGVQVLAAGSRVVDAIAAAGGPRRGVSLSSVNQAQVLTDGEQIIVGGEAVPAAAAGGGGAGAVSGGGSASGGLVNLNTATVEQLDTLPDVGPVTAQAIVTYREQHGPFTSVNQLMEIQGIGEKTLADIAPQATV